MSIALLFITDIVKVLTTWCKKWCDRRSSDGTKTTQMDTRSHVLVHVQSKVF